MTTPHDGPAPLDPEALRALCAELRTHTEEANWTPPLMDNLNGEVFDSEGHYIGEVRWTRERNAILSVVNGLPALLSAVDALLATVARVEALAVSYDARAAKCREKTASGFYRFDDQKLAALTSAADLEGEAFRLRAELANQEDHNDAE